MIEIEDEGDDTQPGFLMSPKRVLVFFFSQIIRLIIAIALLITGVLFLAHTVKIEDLLLNTLALQFIMGLDEDIYATFAPRRLKKTMSRTQVLKIRRARQFDGLDKAGILKFATAVVLLIIVYLTVISP